VNEIFAPGCALMLYKPELAAKMHNYLNKKFNNIGLLSTCCKHTPDLSALTDVINVCPGCQKRFNNDYPFTKGISFWEILDEDNNFPFPDYNGEEMTILDACPTRNETNIHTAIRSIVRKMNINIIEPDKTGIHGVCCGDSFYGLLPVEKVIEQMEKRASEMPGGNVIVYCISCIKAMKLGGKNPRFLGDIVFNELTTPGQCDPDIWHKEIDEYIAVH
jgi:Fe-S oxidoreductase